MKENRKLKHVCISAIIMLVTVLISLLLLLLLPYIVKIPNILYCKNIFNINDIDLRGVATLLLFIPSIFALGFTFWRNALQGDANIEIERNNHAEESQKALQEAIGHLGHDSSAVCLGAIYELMHYAKKYKKQEKNTVVELLCGYIRSHTQEEKYIKKHTADMDTEGIKNIHPEETVQTILKLLFINDPNYFFIKKDRIGFVNEINGKRLDNKKLDNRAEKFDFSGACLEGASFEGFELRDVSFRDANLQSTDFQGATLSNIDFSGADLQKAEFIGDIIKLQNCDRASSQPEIKLGENVSFEGANFAQVIIIKNKEGENTRINGQTAEDSILISEKWINGNQEIKKSFSEQQQVAIKDREKYLYIKNYQEWKDAIAERDSWGYRIEDDTEYQDIIRDWDDWVNFAKWLRSDKEFREDQAQEFLQREYEQSSKEDILKEWVKQQPKDKELESDKIKVNIDRKNYSKRK